MQVRELINALDSIDKFARKHNLSNQYKKLTIALNQARKKPTPESTGKIVQQRDRIRSIHHSVETQQLLPSTQMIYERLGVFELLGAQAMNRVDNIFQSHEADPNSIIQSIEEIGEQTNQLLEHIGILMEGLKPLSEEEQMNYTDTNLNTIQLQFPLNSSPPTIQNLDDSLQKWDRVFAAFSKLIRHETEDSIIQNIEKSPLMIEVGIVDGISESIGRAACEVLSVYEKYLDIKRVGLEVNSLELRNRGISEQLDKEANLLIRNTASDVTKAMMEEFEWKKEANRSDVHNQISAAVATIFDFVKDSGRIDICNGRNSYHPVQQELAAAFTKVRDLENRISKLDFLMNQETIGANDSENDGI